MIKFNSEEIPMPSLDYDLIKRWVEAVVEAHGFEVAKLNYLFCDDEYILEVNRKHLNHDYYTDIITFDYSIPEVRDDNGVIIRKGRVAGDMVISLDTVFTNAEKFGYTTFEELLRVIIHGVLHMFGINDKGPGEREIMEEHENKALEMFRKMRDENL
jgi:rRNA maturation RNase YbeY